MYIPEKLKINRFKDVRIPDKKSYFAQYGNSLGIMPPSQEDYHQEGRKTETADDLLRYDAMMQEKQK